jgi:putative membrane protein
VTETSPPVAQNPQSYLAAERTFLAWIRTGLALMGFGFVVARFGLFLREAQTFIHAGSPRSSVFSLWSGTGLVLLGVVLLLVSVVRYRDNILRLQRGEMPRMSPSRTAMGIAIILAALGIAIAVYLLYFR